MDAAKITRCLKGVNFSRPPISSVYDKFYKVQYVFFQSIFTCLYMFPLAKLRCADRNPGLAINALLYMVQDFTIPPQFSPFPWHQPVTKNSHHHHCGSLLFHLALPLWKLLQWYPPPWW